MKKSWKKHSDIQDVEDYLEDKRLQERTGGLVAEKKDDQLFFLDSAPVEGDKTTLKTASTNLGGKKRKIHEPARCYANLQPDARVPVPNTDQKGELGKKKKRILPAGKRRDDLQWGIGVPPTNHGYLGICPIQTYLAYLLLYLPYFL